MTVTLELLSAASAKLSPSDIATIAIVEKHCFLNIRTSLK
jgi:hypothetical protein